MGITKMRLTALNPDYENNLPLWQKMYDAYEGEDRVKDRLDKYLPKTQVMVNDKNYYLKYVQMAVFPEHTYKAVESFLGCLHREKPKITLPDSISFMEKEATYYGESIVKVLEEINFYQLLYGRVAIGVDVRKDEKGSARPYIVIYPPEKIKNWGVSDLQSIEIKEAKLPAYSFIVIDESGQQLNEINEWIPLTQHRVLKIVNNVYMNGVFKDNNYDENQMLPLSTQSGTFDKIPFVFCNVKDLKPNVQRPPLLGLANLCYAIYRGDADYRQDLHRQSQDTLFTFGIPRPDAGLHVGAGAVVDAPVDARAEFVGVTGVGLEEQRIALDSLNTQALHDAGQFMNTPSKQSAEGINLFLTATMSALNQIASTGAEALTTILKLTCEWMGVKDIEKLEVIPNTDFVDSQMTAEDVIKLWTTVQSGGLSPDSYFTYLNRKGVIERSPEEEIDKIDEAKEKVVLDNVSYGNVNGVSSNQSNGSDTSTDQKPKTKKAVGTKPNENAVPKN